MIEFTEETFDQCIEESAEKLVAQWKETEMHQDKMVLDPDWEKYQQLAASGVAKFFIARDDGKMVGYIVYFIVPHMHHKTLLFADSDIFFLDKEYRGTSIAKSLLEFSESKLKEYGVSVIMSRMKADFPIEGLAKSLGFKKEEISYSKWVGE